jgi:MoaA/NifB/PqqE/SkfB family radical SAM enzyme
MINDKNKDTWCVNAYHAMSGMNNGTTKICCMHRPEEHNMILGKDKISDILQKKEFRKIQKSLQKGIRHKGCRLCWEEEDAGRQSKRLRDNERYFHEIEYGKREPYQGLAKVELNLGNTCNISCRTCNACVSSGWMKEEFEVYERGNYNTYKDFANSMKKYHMSYDDDSPFWEDIESHLPTIKQFDFYGGEPFMIKKQWKLIQKAVELGYSKDIEIHYNTNGTHWPKEVELWQYFKQINLSFSIDGINDQFEYMRYPAKWDLVKQNIENARNLAKEYGNISVSWCVTISSINVYNIPETIDYWRAHYSKDVGLYLNLVHGPAEYNIKNIPNTIKSAIVEKLNTVPKTDVKSWGYLDAIINFINSEEYSVDAWNKFLHRTQTHDIYRNQSFDSTFLEYSKIIKEYL